MNNTFTIKGSATQISVYAHVVEESALQQLHHVANCPAFSDSQIVIMPDVHAGKGAVIGFTATLGELVCPNVVGVDIGCGVIAANLGPSCPDFPKLDKFIRTNIPSGHSVRQSNVIGNSKEEELMEQVHEVGRNIQTAESLSYYVNSIGTLGGGNHFIEVGKGERNDYWIIIHSGSRKFGNDIGNYYWKHAKKLENYSNGKKKLAWLGGSDRDDYLFAANIAQQYAKLNRKAMMDSLLHYLGFDFAYTERVESVHNYIDFTDTVSMIRKGAISAKKGERVIIPMNMAYGCVLGTGLGKALWNNSAPHGAGRAMSRSVAKKSITLDEFKAVMTDVWSSCVQQSTIDEAPQAYKQVDDVLDYLSETVTLDTKIKSVYNFKST